MATTPKPTRKIDVAKLLNRTGYGAEAKRAEAAAIAQRTRDIEKILSTDDLANRRISGERLLYTTLGGQVRPITDEDLRVFAKASQRLGKRFEGGITAAGVINASLKIDRDRANDEIKTAVVVKAQKGVMHVVTNSGPNSDVVRHHCFVEFPTFASMAATPKKPAVLAKAMLGGPLRMSCDCGRFRFWFSYIATRGGFKHGVGETGFPKIRNPKLAGVACKHLLRVMQSVIKDANFRTAAEKMIAAGQSNDTKAQTLTPTEQRAIAQRQAETAHHVRNKIETTAQNVLRRAKGDPAKVKALYTAVKIAAERKIKAMAGSKKPPSVAAVKEVEATIAALGKNPVITAAQRDKLIAQLMALKTV